MKLRQAKKIFYREYVSVPYYKKVKVSNKLIKAINILRHFRRDEYWPIKIYKNKEIYLPSNSSQYEKVLNAHYERLKRQGRSSDLASLKRKKGN